jgi:hypothetical protein
MLLGTEGVCPAAENETASLDGISGVGKVIVTSMHPEAGEDVIRQEVERRLGAADLSIADGSDTEFVVDVLGWRDSSDSVARCRHYAYIVTFMFREPVRAERAQDRVFIATTWRHQVKISRFSQDVPAQSVLDDIGSGVNTFIRAVRSAKQRGRE